MNPISRRSTPDKKPPTPYAARIRITNPSSHVTALPEPRAVSFFQRRSDLCHHSVHFSVRQGALGASESQGECDALVSLRNLGAMVFVEGARHHEELAG